MAVVFVAACFLLILADILPEVVHLAIWLGLNHCMLCYAHLQEQQKRMCGLTENQG
jgi:hypothetical protein